jgi:hypothetical protein
MVLVAVLAPGCEDDTPTEANPAEVTLTFTPNPVSAQPSPNPEFEWRATFTVTVTETAGVGGTISSISLTLYEAAGGIVISTPDQAEDVVESVSATTNRIDAFGTATIGFNVDYRLPGEGREALIDVSVSVEDDNDLFTTESERVGVL